MATIAKVVSPEVVKKFPTPAHLGAELLYAEGYLFGETPVLYIRDDIHVPIYNQGVSVGFISYLRQDDGSVKVYITDTISEFGNILTRAAVLVLVDK